MAYKYNEPLAEAYVQMVEEAKNPMYDSDLHKELVDHVKHVLQRGTDRKVYNDKRLDGSRSLNANWKLDDVQQTHLDKLSKYGVTIKAIKHDWDGGARHHRVLVPVPSAEHVAEWESNGKPSLGRPYGETPTVQLSTSDKHKTCHNCC